MFILELFAYGSEVDVINFSSKSGILKWKWKQDERRPL